MLIWIGSPCPNWNWEQKVPKSVCWLPRCIFSKCYFGNTPLYPANTYLVGGWPTPLKNMKVSWGYYSQYMEKSKNSCSKPPTRYDISTCMYTNINIYIYTYVYIDFGLQERLGKKKKTVQNLNLSGWSNTCHQAPRGPRVALAYLRDWSLYIII